MKKMVFVIIFLMTLPCHAIKNPFNATTSLPYLLPEQLYYDISYYEIDITIDTNSDYIEGEIRIRGTIVQNNTLQIVLNFFDHMTIDSVFIQTQSLSYAHENDILTIDLPQPLNSGDLFDVTINYYGYPGQSGTPGYGMIFSNNSGQKLVYTYNWPYYANTYIPCKDHPSDKADSVRILITVPDNFTVASNGVLSATNTLPGNLRQFDWITRYSISPYHLSINVHPFDVVQSSYTSAVSGTIPLEYYLFPSHTSTAQPQLETEVPKIHEAFEANYGAFPFSNEKYGICESLINGGMEHQTILTMNYPSFFSDIVVHESAHEYFGNMISIADWGHIWLSEGFATYSEAIFREYWEGPSGYQQEINQHMSGAGNGVIFVSDPSSPNNIIPYALVYLKASTVIHMLRFVMGDNLFFQMLHDFVTSSPYRYGNIDTEQFRLYCEGYYGSNLSWFFDQWIYKDGKMAAEYYYTWNNAGDTLTFMTHSIPSSISSTTYHEMPVPVKFTTNSLQITDTLWIDSLNLIKEYHFSDSSNLSIQIDPDNKILKGPFTYLDHPILLSAILQQNAIQLEWKQFFNYTDYEVHVWREVSAGSYTFISSMPVSGQTHSFTPTQIGNYRVAVRGVKNGEYTNFSNFREVIYTNFPMDQGILVVDETRNGNGTHMLNPTDEVIDAFYDSLLANYNHAQFDVFSEGRPPDVLDLAHYWLVVWHHDVTFPTQIDQSEDDLVSYMHAGGKIIFSGMNYLYVLGSQFTEPYLGFVNPLLNSPADLIAAEGARGFNNLNVDTSKIDIPIYNNKLPQTTVFDTTTQSNTIYRSVTASGHPLYHQKPCGIIAPSVVNPAEPAVISLGLPLYFIEMDSAALFIDESITRFGGPVKINTAFNLPSPSQISLKCYPNPFNPTVHISFNLYKSMKTDVVVYNVLGQKVRQIYSGKLNGGTHSFSWDGRNQAKRPLGSGIYFVRLATPENESVRKILLQR